jgi:single-strand DNA-binding protein
MEEQMSLANEFRIHGNLASDVRGGRTGGGVTTAFYVVAIDRKFRTKDGIQSTTDFIPITTYGKQAESDLKYLAKGKEVAVRGHIRSWYDSDKQKGGFCFEPDPGCVRYIGAPIERGVEVALDGDHDVWLQSYEQNQHQFDDVPNTTRPSRIAAHA